MSAKPRPGRHIELHFNVLAWLCAGPARTKKEFGAEFLCEPDKSKVYFDMAIRAGFIKQDGKIPGRSGAKLYVPLRVMGPTAQEK